MTPPTPFPDALQTRLADLPRRSRGIVVRHDADAGTAERLAAVGLGVGAAFEVLRSGRRPTVRVGESRIGLGPELACAVRVHALPASPPDAAKTPAAPDAPRRRR